MGAGLTQPHTTHKLQGGLTQALLAGLRLRVAHCSGIQALPCCTEAGRCLLVSLCVFDKSINVLILS